MLIGTKASTSNSSIVTSLNGQNLTHVSNIKLLGLQIDNVLNWKLHIDSIGNTLSSKVGLLHNHNYRVLIVVCVSVSVCVCLCT